MFHRYSTNRLPGWLWFFLILPMTLIVALLYKRQRLPTALQQQIEQQLQKVTHEPPRYTEPDSIPLDMSDVHPAAVPFESTPLEPEALDRDTVEPVLGLDDEDIAIERAAQLPAADTSDDLKVIEGIGPAIDRLLHENGVRTYAALAETPVARLQEILAEARLSRLSDPTTWPEQAKLAAEGRWEALDEMQRSLKGGRRKTV